MTPQAPRAETRIDPVCGMTVDMAEALADSRTMEFDGKEFGFCSRGCLVEFHEAPTNYAQQDSPATD